MAEVSSKMGVDVQARVFTSVPIDKKQLDDYLLLENQRVESCAMCQEMIRSGYYVEAMKRLSKAFPEVVFTTVYQTDISMSALFTEKFKAGEITQKETRYKYKFNEICESLESVSEHFREKHEEAEDTCRCQFCVVQHSLSKEMTQLMKTATDTYAKKHELHEITKMLPLKEKEDEKIQAEADYAKVLAFIVGV